MKTRKTRCNWIWIFCIINHDMKGLWWQSKNIPGRPSSQNVLWVIRQLHSHIQIWIMFRFVQGSVALSTPSTLSSVSPLLPNTPVPLPCCSFRQTSVINSSWDMNEKQDTVKNLTLAMVATATFALYYIFNQNSNCFSKEGVWCCNNQGLKDKDRKDQ